MVNIFNYIPKKSPIHELTGASKFLMLVFWMLAAMTTFNTPLLLVMTMVSIVLFKISKIKFNDIKFMLYFTMFFLFLNNLLIYLFSPELGVDIYGTKHLLFNIIGRYTVTQEQLFYHLNVILKYTATIPIVLLFVSTTHPSEFASSLNRVGISYRVSYGIALALRYIPGFIDNYKTISLSQQARGIELSSKENLFKRFKSAANIVIPLILSSFDRIETIANAMELRGFGKHDKRTWYMGRDFKTGDILGIVLAVLLLILSIAYSLINGSRFWNPFA